MPAHDWTKVDVGTFHSFHNAWITHLMGDSTAECYPGDIMRSRSNTPPA
jgi:hypothetical protein